MEMTNIYIYGTIGALLCLVIGAMLGYARYEYQQLHASALQREHLQACDAKWRELLNDAKNHAAAHESSWKFADEYRAAVVQAMTDLGIWDYSSHGGDPVKMLGDLAIHVAKQAIDPTLSQKAKNLHTRGVRAGAKKGRAQMQKLMQKSIDNQAGTINKLYSMYDDSVAVRQRFKDAVINTLNDKVALPGVRKSIREAINVECERLRLASVKQGA